MKSIFVNNLSLVSVRNALLNNVLCFITDGITVPNIRQWNGPVAGFTFHCWIRLEQLDDTMPLKRRQVYSFYTSRDELTLRFRKLLMKFLDAKISPNKFCPGSGFALNLSFLDIFLELSLVFNQNN